MAGLSAEDGKASRAIALAGTGKRVLLTHRGTLDPCAFWQTFGHSRQSFSAMKGTSLEDHYRRYDAVIHLASAAVRVPEAYRRWPEEHRPEDLWQAAELDGLLREVWGGHPGFVEVAGEAGAGAKLAMARGWVREAMQEGLLVGGRGAASGPAHRRAGDRR
ncbi:MAG: AAA family ATPase [Armatimonadetes bacterium]|nr:AAA family ATPase [Armatimonadota bacterium]